MCDRTTALGKGRLVSTILNGPKQIDGCIADLVQEMNERDIRTISCCCGHGKWSGVIVIESEDREKAEELGYGPFNNHTHDMSQWFLNAELPNRGFSWDASGHIWLKRLS